jgi:A/G-specific adenine glycosylase
MAVLREAEGSVARSRLDGVWSDGVQRDRALASLLEDGLVVPAPDGRYALPD